MAKSMTANEIRESFKNYFASKGHTIVPSAPMVIKDDPTLMFTNAGMNQWKDIILGTREPEPRRRADSQKCLRVSGKHNDLEEVGHDTYHHTMFEMLGNWSFGDYFKEGAIDMAWEYLVDVLKLDPADLYVTVFEGSAEENIPRDDEAASYWAKHVPADHIINGDKHDNFWEMGDTGPCGPCSEIHLDSRTPEQKAAVPGRELVNKDDPQVIEIWNIVFMQFNRKADGSLEPLPMHVIDTGMGFERLVRALQGKHSNYDTDVFTPMIHRLEEITGLKYGEKEDVDVAMRVIADHIRAISFSIADGQLPSNVKAGYVIRRILRRAVRYGYTFLGFNEPFLCRLVDQLATDMGEAYPEIVKQKQLIESVIREEEMAFLRTLDRGIRLMDDYMAKSAGTKTISGKDAFVLYDTYGFPLDLTELIATEKGYKIDIEGFNKELAAQKDRARNATSNEFGDWIVCHEGESEEFLGYDFTELHGVSLLKQRTVKQKNKGLFQLVFDRTPFYAEMGGQVGDTGWIESEDGEKIKILNTVKENGLTVHIAEKLPENGTGRFSLHIDTERRLGITNNHTATHLLDHALRLILGEHVEQKGSFVGPDYFRFDFSHFSKVTDEQIREAEKLVNSYIRANYPLQEKRDATMEEAKEMGAIALFGEKYGDVVRVVKFGDSVELCGGTHAASTGQIGYFKIVSEGAVAAGVRRIEALTGARAEEFAEAAFEALKGAKAFFNNASDLTAAIKRLVDENAGFKKDIEGFMEEKAAGFAEKLQQAAETINGVKVVRFNGNADPNFVRMAAGKIQKEAQNLVFAGAFEYEGKPNLVLMYSADLVAAGKNAGKDVREAAKLIQGGGGGQPGLASAGGKNVAGLKDALAAMVAAATE